MKTLSKQKELIVKEENRVTFAEAQKIIKENGGQMIELKDIIFSAKNLKQRKKLEQNRYWISNQGKEFQNMGYHKIDFEKGELVPVSKNEHDKLPFSHMAYVSKGAGPVDVNGFDGWGLGVDASSPTGYAMVAFFIPIDAPQKGKIVTKTLEKIRRV